jgi:hypothetical protein
MKMTNFLFESLYQVITWVFIALAVGSIFYFLSKGNTRGVLWSSVGLVCFVAVMIGIVGDHYFFRSEVQTTAPAKERAYVFIEGTSLAKPLSAGEKPILMIYLTNSGVLEATGFLKDLSFYWTSDHSMQSFPYYQSKGATFSLAPTAHFVVRFKPDLVLNEEMVKGIVAGTIRLLFYARGEYKDSERSYPLSFCRQYDSDMPGNLINCGEGIEFKDAEGTPKPENKLPPPPN